MSEGRYDGPCCPYLICICDGIRGTLKYIWRWSQKWVLSSRLEVPKLPVITLQPSVKWDSGKKAAWNFVPGDSESHSRNPAPVRLAGIRLSVRCHVGARRPERVRPKPEQWSLDEKGEEIAKEMTMDGVAGIKQGWMQLSIAGCQSTPRMARHKRPIWPNAIMFLCGPWECNCGPIMGCWPLPRCLRTIRHLAFVEPQRHLLLAVNPITALFYWYNECLLWHF